MNNPLAPPDGPSSVLAEYLRRMGLSSEPATDFARAVEGVSPVAVLERVASAFARLPYENLTKIVKKAESGSVEEARRRPAEVLADHYRLGAGGTCYALTSTLLHLVRALGFQAEPLLADRRYGADTHSAVLVWIDGRPHLLDPGYLLVRPLPVPREGEIIVATEFNDVILRPSANGRKVELFTRDSNQGESRSTYRLTFKTEPASTSDFLRAWDASFEYDILKYPVLSRVADGRQLYLQKNHVMERSRDDVSRMELSPEQLASEIASRFGVDADLARKALSLLRRQGERIGK